MARKVTVSPYFYLFLPAAFLLLPLRWILGWCLAVSVHETGHYLALHICRIPIESLEITPFGIRMYTGSLTNREALLCALAGPLCGLLVIALSRFLPYTAICAFVQTIFNLIPIYPLDGGRALRAMLSILTSRESTVYTVENLIFLFIIGLGVYILWHLDLNFVPSVLLIGIIAQKFLANRRNNGYNRGENAY